MVDRIKLARSNLTSGTQGRTTSSTSSSYRYVPPSNLHNKINQYYLSKTATASSTAFPPDYSDKFHFRIKMGHAIRGNGVNIQGVGQVGIGQGISFQKVKHEIILPMPHVIRDTHGIHYSVEEIGIVAGQIQNLATSIVNDIKQGKNPISIQNAINGAAAVAATGISAAGQGVQNAVDKMLLGLALNRWLTVMFKSPNYKKYEFTWLLSPRNEKESEIIKTIYQKINYEAAPRLVMGDILFEFPTIFQCEFSNHEYNYDTRKFPAASETEDKEGKMYRFKPSVVEQCTVDFTPAGSPGFYVSGYPVSVALNISFHELEFWLKDHGYNDPINKSTN